MQGTIKTVRLDGGYGFIRPDAGGQDVFFHAQALAPDGDTTFTDLAPGDHLEFDTEPSARKPGTLQAINVRALN